MILIGHPARLVLVGFGSVGRGLLPLIFRHILIDPARITVITADDAGAAAARWQGVGVQLVEVTEANYRELLPSLLGPDDLLVNLGLHVASAALIEVCQELGALYLDTAIEPWPNVYRNLELPLAQRTSHAMRQSLRNRVGGKGHPTALVGHGANPGLVSHFVKQALLTLAADVLGEYAMPGSQREWALLAKTLGIKVIHVTERDTQAAAVARTCGEFVNTWSAGGLIDEACQPAELGWGTHERNLPPDGHHPGDEGSVFLAQSGAETLMRSWTPSSGPYQGFLLSHPESLTIADFYTVGEGSAVQWRPTVQFVYRPCDDALASIIAFSDAGWTAPRQTRVLLADIVQGADELGILLMGHPRSSLWFGSHLTSAEAQSLAPPNNATTLQVTAGILGGLVWILENPRVGLIEPDEIDHERMLEIARPYLGELKSVYSSWTPLDEPTEISQKDIDPSCPWQFRNFRVS